MADAESVIFYRETRPNGIFCNYFRLSVPLKYKGKLYATSEHLYQSLKFDYIGAPERSLEYAEIIRKINTPNKARILALMKCSGGYKWRTDLNDPIRQYRDEHGVTIRSNWNELRLAVMLHVLRIKFSQNKHAKHALLATGSKLIVENSPRDSFWGVGADGCGKNNLGRLLMQVRRELRHNADKETTVTASSKRKLNVVETFNSKKTKK